MISVMASKKVPKKVSQGLSPWFTSWEETEKAFETFRQDLEKSFESFPLISMPNFPKIPETSCDVIDEGKQLKIKLNVPGVQKKDIKLNVTDNSLEVSAQHKEESEEKKKNYLKKERSQISYYRTLPLSEKVVTGKTKAKLVDGVLEIVLPKSKPTKVQKKKPISVQ